MKNLYFDDFEVFSCVIANKFNELDKENFEDIAVIAKYDEVKEILKNLIFIGYDICSITLDIPDKYGYNDEYILGVSNDGFWVEKFKRENGYFEDESTVIYILDNCSSKVIPYCKGKYVYEVTVAESYCECECKKDEKNITPTTSTAKSTYRVNGKECDNETYKKALNELDEKYLDNVHDMLLSYCEFIDEMNEWRKLLGW